MLKGGAIALVRLNLGEKYGVVFAIRDVFGKVGDAPVPVGRLEVIVEPAEQDLVRREFEEVLVRFALLEQTVEFWVVLQIDRVQ